MALYQKPRITTLWAQSGAVDEPTDIKLAQGWVEEIPPCETQNWWQLRIDQAMRHVYEAGIPVWDAFTSYTAGRSIVQASNGVLYRALIDNTGQNPLTTTAWRAVIDESRFVPPGAIFYTAGAIPAGYFETNGAAISRSAYPELFAVLGTTYGGGDGVNTFNLPDTRGLFIRSLDSGRGIDIGRTLNSAQQSANLTHNHTGETTLSGAHSHGGSILAAGQHAHSGQTFAAGEHAHGGAATYAGDHSHTFPGMNGTPLTVTPGFPNFISQPGGAPSTSVAGGHTHPLSIDPNGNHGHSLAIDANGNHVHGLVIEGVGNHTHLLTTNWAGTNESRPINIAFRTCIKF